MKLGEALKLRSDNLRRVEELRTRIVSVAQVQEGTKPSDDPNTLIREMEQLLTETTLLIQRINRTNVVTRLQNGALLSDALAERDMTLARRNQLQSIAKAANEPQARYMRSEIRVVRTIEPAPLLKRADELSKQHRELDTAIQELNWTVDLLD